MEPEERRKRRGAALRRWREAAGATLSETGILSGVDALKIKAAESGQEELAKQERAAVETSLLRLLEEHARAVAKTVAESCQRKNGATSLKTATTSPPRRLKDAVKSSRNADLITH